MQPPRAALLSTNQHIPALNGNKEKKMSSRRCSCCSVTNSSKCSGAHLINCAGPRMHSLKQRGLHVCRSAVEWFEALHVCLLSSLHPSSARFQSFSFFFYADHRVVNSYEEDQSLHSWLAWCSPDINRNPVVQLRERNEQRRKDKRQAECGGKTKRECVEAWGI